MCGFNPDTCAGSIETHVRVQFRHMCGFNPDTCAGSIQTHVRVQYRHMCAFNPDTCAGSIQTHVRVQFRHMCGFNSVTSGNLSVLQPHTRCDPNCLNSFHSGSRGRSVQFMKVQPNCCTGQVQRSKHPGQYAKKAVLHSAHGCTGLTCEMVNHSVPHLHSSIS